MGSDKECLKVLMFPWLAHGHITPFLELAKRLSDRNFHSYICSTPANLTSIADKIPQKYSNSIHLLTSTSPLPPPPPSLPHHQRPPPPPPLPPPLRPQSGETRLLRHLNISAAPPRNPRHSPALGRRHSVQEKHPFSHVFHLRRSHVLVLLPLGAAPGRGVPLPRHPSDGV
ncbi:UNVERIFIED_CONTAM: Flavanone 7-O-glucoside 2''-O-beta-L-rhamnosyltransferase [Sesamum radiatum]|uniref:Flavanone 7-O-glucoside 2''-O-beta-L-rhamnosyltransferase n=1 Tax=Sesamum radiatum TaxID=300843 RepID=A0AAW2TG59_SESRA